MLLQIKKNEQKTIQCRMDRNTTQEQALSPDSASPVHGFGGVERARQDAARRKRGGDFTPYLLFFFPTARAGGTMRNVFARQKKIKESDANEVHLLAAIGHTHT